MNTKQHVFVAMSGGVDSAVAAVRLLEADYSVTGIFMETWQDPRAGTLGDSSSAPVDMAASAAEKIGIPFVSLDVRDRFFQVVIRRFIKQYVAGQTPNPCLFCNPQVKWGILQNYALSQGADFFATGHYARIHRGDDDRVQLFRGADPSKDQSYVLAMLTQQQLGRSLLPLGDLTKTEVRRQAQLLDLPVANRPESQDLCFLGDVDYRDFLQRYAPESVAPGEIVNLNGEVLGEHQGLAFYTIGQRRGIKLAAPAPYNVIDKDPQTNRLIVGFADQAGKGSLQAVEPNWISGEPPAEGDVLTVMTRYRANPVPATVIHTSMREFRLKFNQLLRGVTPGQVAVLYREEMCLGGGIIKNAW
jgi:tRNA-specific 2-thiouridylase